MPLPLLFIGIAAATGGLGVGKTIKAGMDTNNANKLNKSAADIVNAATEEINTQRKACGNSLHSLGEEKLFVLDHSINEFLNTFSKIKNVDFRDSEGIEELQKLHIDKQDFEELRAMANFAVALAGGAVAGAAGGALIAFGAYGAAQALACASTGTAIASLSGAAATNATLAFFGGGSLAAGGLGMAGGVAVLGGLVAGPALMAMGFIVGHTAKKELEKARNNKADALQSAAQLHTASLQCETIRRRIYMLYNLLARLDTYFLPLIYSMEDIFEKEGDDYRNYTPESKKIIASCASVAVSIKSVLDTPILTDDGLLTNESKETVSNVEEFLKHMRIPY